MKAVIFDGSAVDDLAGRRIRRLLTDHLSAKGAVTEVWTIRDLKITPCAGDFFCWIRTPGQCIFDDDNRRLAAAVVNSDLLIYLTPVTFGGYSACLKRAVDHLIQNVLPFFIKLEGETHHQKRYTAYPDFLAIGWLDQPEPDAEACFRNLVRRNAINMHARRFCGGIVLAGQPDEAIATAIGDWLNWPSPATEPAGSAPIGYPAAESLFRPVRQAVLLVGSPKLRQSTSHALGRYLLDQFDPAAVSANTFFLPAINHSPEKMAAMFQAV